MPTRKKSAKSAPKREQMTPDKAMDALIQKIDAINQSRDVDHGFAAPMFASLALASQCTGKPEAPVDLSKYLADDSPDDGACRSQTSLFRSTERNSTGCHRGGCAYATGSAWLPSVLGEYCTSCDTFLTEANAGGKTAALVRFFWFSSIAIDGHSDATPCVAQEDLVDLAFALLASRGEKKAIQYCLDFDEKRYDAVIKSKAFREGVAELKGEYSRYKKAAALIALAAMVGAAVYLHTRDERGLRGAWADVSTKLSGLYTSTFAPAPAASTPTKKPKKRKTPRRSTAPSFDEMQGRWDVDASMRESDQMAKTAADSAAAAAKLKQDASAARAQRRAAAKASIDRGKQGGARKRRASAPAPLVDSVAVAKRRSEAAARRELTLASGRAQRRAEKAYQDSWLGWTEQRARDVKRGLGLRSGYTNKEWEARQQAIEYHRKRKSARNREVAKAIRDVGTSISEGADAVGAAAGEGVRTGLVAGVRGLKGGAKALHEFNKAHPEVLQNVEYGIQQGSIGLAQVAEAIASGVQGAGGSAMHAIEMGGAFANSLGEQMQDIDTRALARAMKKDVAAALAADNGDGWAWGGVE